MDAKTKKIILNDMRDYLRTWNIHDDALAQKVADKAIDAIENGDPIKVFLSLPMHGKTNSTIFRNLSQMAKYVREMHMFGDNEIKFVDNFMEDVEKPAEDTLVNPNLFYLGRAVKKMANVNAVVFHPDWKTARGCCIEKEVCSKYGIPAYEIVPDGKPIEI